MNKIALLLLILTFSGCATFRPVPVENGKLLGILPLREGKVYYEFNQAVPGASARTIYRAARRWVAFRVPDARQALAVGDSQTLDIIATGELQPTSTDWKKGRPNGLAFLTVYYAISIETYEGGYRVAISGIRSTESHLTPKLLYAASYTQYSRPIEQPTRMQLRLLRDLFAQIDASIIRQNESLRRYVAEQSAGR